jgi:hypothetical protein
MSDDEYAGEKAKEVECDAGDRDDDDNDGDGTVQQLKVMLKLIGAKPWAAQSDFTRFRNDKQTFVNWCRLPSLLRPVYYQKVAQLRVFAGALMPPYVVHDAKVTASKLRDGLKTYLESNPNTLLSQCAAASIELTKQQSLMHAIIYLIKLPTKTRQT